MAVSITVPTIEPTEVVAGDTWTWKKSLDTFPADEWTLVYHLVKDDHRIEITASAEGTDHLVEEVPTDTAEHTAGVYKYQARVTKNAESYIVETGTIEVRPNFAAQTMGYDDRSNAKKIVDAIDAVLVNKASQDQQSISIGGRALSRFSWSELVEARKEFHRIYIAEERKAGRLSKAVGVSL